MKSFRTLSSRLDFTESERSMSSLTVVSSNVLVLLESWRIFGNKADNRKFASCSKKSVQLDSI